MNLAFRPHFLLVLSAAAWALLLCPAPVLLHPLRSICTRPGAPSVSLVAPSPAPHWDLLPWVGASPTALAPRLVGPHLCPGT